LNARLKIEINQTFKMLGMYFITSDIFHNKINTKK